MRFFIRLILLAIRLILRANVSKKPALLYERDIKHYDKDFFDAHYPFQFYKHPVQDMPDYISYYQSAIGHVTLRKRQTQTFFEIYETKVISDKELAMNVRACYADFVQTGISRKVNSVVTQNHYFVLNINNKLNQLEVKSSIDEDITEKMIKKEFGEYLIKYLLLVQRESAKPAIPVNQPALS